MKDIFLRHFYKNVLRKPNHKKHFIMLVVCTHVGEKKFSFNELRVQSLEFLGVSSFVFELKVTLKFLGDAINHILWHVMVLLIAVLYFLCCGITVSFVCAITVCR